MVFCYKKNSSEILFIYLSLFYGRVFSALIYFNKNNACLTVYDMTIQQYVIMILKWKKMF